MRSVSDLYAYQQEARMHMWQHPDSMLWLGTGMGKTVSTLTNIVDRMNALQVQKVLIFGPLRVIQAVWAREARKWEHTKHLRFSVVHGTREKRLRALFAPADIYLCNYENMNWLAEVLDHYYISQNRPLPFQMVVYDECFVQGTMVSTPTGDVPIESLHKGDLVNTHKGPRVVVKAMKRSAEDFVTVTFNNGRSFTTTPNHPVLVGGRTWLPAGLLRKGYEVSNDQSFNQTFWTGSVPDLRCDFLEAQTIPDNLLPQLPQCVDGQIPEYAGSDESEREETGETQSEKWIVESRVTVLRGITTQDVNGATHEGPFTSDGGQWHGGLAMRESAADSSACTIHSGMRSVFETPEGWLSDTLQAGLRGSRSENRDRGSRGKSRICVGEREGFEKKNDAGIIRVDSVVYHKRRGSADVWNLSVDDAETYFAEGILVHNCTKTKNSTSLRVAGGNRDRKDKHGKTHKIKVTGWRGVIPRFQYRTGLTGTPASNGYLDLHGQYLVVDGGKRLGEYLTHYKNSYFESDYMGWSYKPTEQGRVIIEEKISDITKKMDSRDYLDMPAVRTTNIMVDLPPAARKIYQEVEAQLFSRLDSGSEIELFSRTSVSNKCLQIANGSPFVNEVGSGDWQSLHDAKLDALDDVIEEAGGSPVLCSYSFTPDAERIMKRFKGLKPVNMTQTNSKLTEKVINDWNDGKIRLLVAHPASAAHGIDGLQDSGHTVVWFGLNWSLELYDQMNARIDRNGQKHPVSIIRILCNDTVDLAVADALMRKSDDQEGLKQALARYRAGITTNELELSFL